MPPRQGSPKSADRVQQDARVGKCLGEHARCLGSQRDGPSRGQAANVGLGIEGEADAPYLDRNGE